MTLRSFTINRRHGLSLVLATAILAASGALTALAGPEGTSVVHGTADISKSGNETLIRTSNRAILSHTQFNIAPDETVRFLQPDAASRVLNRITGSRPTLIEGALQSNGKLYFVNPHGIHFAGSSVINVGGLYAAAGQISNADFINGVDRFTNLSGSVINDGAINGQQVHLLGRQVINNGSIAVPNGLLTMVAGENVYLAQAGQRISVQVDASNMTSAPGAPGTGVENNGTLSAPRGKIVLGAGDMYSLAIRNRGLVSAPGGDVKIAAAAAAVHNSGTISVSDNGAAGRVLVEAARIEQSGRIEADSAAASGGDIRLLAQQQLVLDPSSVLSARGATTGGFIEVCGRELQIAGAFALEGGVADGALLIDPTAIIVDDALAATLAATSGAITLAADDSILIQAPVALLNNNDFTLTTTTGLITFEADVTGARNLVVTPGSSVVFDAEGPLTVTTSRRQIYNAPVELLTDVTLNATGVTFASTVEATDGPRSLAINASADFRGTVGQAKPLSTLSVAGAANLAALPGSGGGYSVQTTGRQDYYGNVNLQEHTRLKASVVEFHREVEDGRAGATPGQEAALFIDADAIFDSRVTFTSPEDLPNRLVGSVHVTGTTTIAGGLITTARAQTYEKAVTIQNQDACLTSIDGDIRFLSTVNTAVGEGEFAHGLTVDARHGNIQFGDNVGSLTPLAFLTAKAGVNFGKVITINGESITADGDIQFNPDGVEFVPDVATIAAPDGAVTIRSLDGRVVMGQNNKLTALGTLTIEAAERAVLGDLNAFGDINVAASTIEFLTRSPGEVLEFDGVRRPDSGVDIVANGVFRFDGSVIGSGDQPAPRFGSPKADADALGTLAAFDVIRVAPLTTQQFFYTAPESQPIVLDLRIVPLPPENDLATAIFRGPAPFVDRMVRRPLLGPDGRARMQRLAIETRDLTPAERQQLLARTEFFSDLVGLFSQQASQPSVRPVALNRVNRDSALQALDEYEALFLVQSVDPQTGQRVISDQTPFIRATFASAWISYLEEPGEADSAGFAAYLNSLPPDAPAAVFSRRLGALLSVVRSVGLSDLEQRTAVHAVLAPVTPDGMDPQTLGQVLSQMTVLAARPVASDAS